MHNAENNDVIMKLCKKLETYTVQDHWYFWSLIGSKTMQAATIMTLVTHQCENTCKQVQLACNDWSNDVEPMLSTFHVCKDSSESTWMEWIYPTVCAN
jgi:hypothetical protein